MTKGICFLLYGDHRPEALDKLLNITVPAARSLGLPVALLLEEGTRQPRVKFDRVVSFTNTLPGFGPKLLVYLLTPFDLTLYLDADCMVLPLDRKLDPCWPKQPLDRSPFNYAWAMAEKWGMATPYDGYARGMLNYHEGKIRDGYHQWPDILDERLGKGAYLPLLNAGVCFFRKDAPGLREVVEEAMKLVRVGRDDQVCFQTVAHQRGFTIWPLEGRVFNCRECAEGFAPHPGTLIIHQPGWIAATERKETFGWRDMEGWFDYADLYDRALASARDGDHLVEVGSYHGKSASYLAEGIERTGVKVNFHCVDTWAGTVDQPWMVRPIAEQGGSLFDKFKDNLVRAGVWKHVTPWRMRSTEAAALFKDGSCRWVFIDADHGDVAADLRAWLPKLAPDGVIAGHDIEDGRVKRDVEAAFGPDGYWVTSNGHCWVMDARNPLGRF